MGEREVAREREVHDSKKHTCILVVQTKEQNDYRKAKQICVDETPEWLKEHAGESKEVKSI